MLLLESILDSISGLKEEGVCQVSDTKFKVHLNLVNCTEISIHVTQVDDKTRCIEFRRKSSGAFAFNEVLKQVVSELEDLFDVVV